MFDTVEIGVLKEGVNQPINSFFDIWKDLFPPAFVYGKYRTACFLSATARNFS
jgi:hypothetical protein